MFVERVNDVVYRVILGSVDAGPEEEYRSVSRSVGRSVGHDSSSPLERRWDPGWLSDPS